MRSFLLALLTASVAAAAAHGSDLHLFEDAALHAVQFVDAQVGWAVGDEGVIWHSTDGGQSWRPGQWHRARCARCIFSTPMSAGPSAAKELPLGTSSAGVMLYTNDGGEIWHARRST